MGGEVLKIRDHAPQKAENSVPPFFFKKARDNKIYSSLEKIFPPRSETFP